MNRTESPGLGQWVIVAVLVTASLFLLVKLYQFAGSRQFYPTGLTVAGVDIGGMTGEEASEALTERFIEAPVVLHHRNDTFELAPSEVEFRLDLATMISEADFQRTQQDFWAGFWGFLWDRPVEVVPVPLTAIHNREALKNVLDRVSSLADDPAQPPQPVPSTLSFQYGVPGTTVNIEESFDDVEAALYRPSNREAQLVVEPLEPVRPSINLLTRLLVNHLQGFEQQTGGVASVFLMDLDSGEEVAISSTEPVSGMDLLKVPIVLEAYRAIDGVPTLTQRRLISETLVTRPDHESANQLLNVIAGEEDPYLGATIVTESMERLGLLNTFMLAPFDQPVLSSSGVRVTPANGADGIRTQPSRAMQTTAEDIGTLLSMIYFCAQGQGGALLAAYPDQLTQNECVQILEYMGENRIGSLLEQGVPPDTLVAHRHGWISDTHGDAGIILSPGGHYVLVEVLYKPDWLEWEVSAPLMADISRGAYNYFNFDDPYLGEEVAQR